MEVSARTFLACRCRSRTVSESVSKREASGASASKRNADRGRDVVEVRRADAFRKCRNRLVSRSPEPLFPEHARELLEAGGEPSSDTARSAVEAHDRHAASTPRSPGRPQLLVEAFVRRRAAMRNTSRGAARPASMSTSTGPGAAPTICQIRRRNDDPPARYGSEPSRSSAPNVRARGPAGPEQGASLRNARSTRSAKRTAQITFRTRSFVLGFTCGSSRRLISDVRRRPFIAAPAAASAAPRTRTTATAGVAALRDRSRMIGFELPGTSTVCVAALPAAPT